MPDWHVHLHTTSCRSYLRHHVTSTNSAGTAYSTRASQSSDRAAASSHSIPPCLISTPHALLPSPRSCDLARVQASAIGANKTWSSVFDDSTSLSIIEYEYDAHIPPSLGIEQPSHRPIGVDLCAKWTDVSGWAPGEWMTQTTENKVHINRNI